MLLEKQMHILLKKISVKKGHILQRKGDLNSKAYQVESGLLRSYSIDNKGKEHIFMFAPEDWIIADSQPPEVPCDLFIDVLEDAVITVFDKEPAAMVFNKEKEYRDSNMTKLIRRMAVLQKRVIMLMSASAIDRYEHFVETYPEILQRVPQKMIASYLGITPEALSKVKGDKFRKKDKP